MKLQIHETANAASISPPWSCSGFIVDVHWESLLEVDRNNNVAPGSIARVSKKPLLTKILCILVRHDMKMLDAQWTPDRMVDAKLLSIND
jgi:hypothetical protein